MLKTLILILTILTLSTLAVAKQNDYDTYTTIDNHTSNMIVLNKNRYKIFKFLKRIKDIRVSNSNIVGINFEDKSTMPLTQIKVFAKKTGLINLLITFYDGSTKQLNFKIIEDIQDIKNIINSIAPNVELLQIDSSIVLKGSIQDNKILTKIKEILKHSLPKMKVINLLKVINPDKMVRLKLYVAEINNKKGETIKNNWTFLQGDDGTTNIDVTAIMLNSVTLSGGITAVANHTGKYFNTGLTLNYLKTNGVAKVLDETTLVTLENKVSKFHAGGNLLIETSSTSKDGQPISSITQIPYGLELNINVKDIINNQYINLEIDTKSSSLDQANGVGTIPATNEKSIKTSVVVKDGSTIVLGGLINNTNFENFEKIPLLGDIPILGKLFRSKDFQDGNSELVFFITPKIIDTSINKQNRELNTITNKVKIISK